MAAPDGAGHQRRPHDHDSTVGELTHVVRHLQRHTMAISPFARRALAAAALFVCAAVSLTASSPKFFVAATQADFLKGDLENLSLDARGQLTLGPASELVYETPSPFLWTVVPAPDGTLYVGTGNDGKVFKVDPQGHGSQ